EAVQTTALTRGVVSAVDRFLNVAAGFFQNLAHLARHVGGVLFLVLDQDLAESKQKFSALGCGSVTPAIERALCGVDRCFYVVAGREWKAANDIARVSRVDVFKHLA